MTVTARNIAIRGHWGIDLVVAFETIADLSTAVTLTPPEGATRCAVQADGGSIRWVPNGTPTASEGMIIADGGIMDFVGLHDSEQATVTLLSADGAAAQVLWYR